MMVIRVRARGLLTGIAVVMAVTVVGLAVVLRDSNNHSRQQLIRGFEQREGIGAALFEALLNGAISSGSVPSNLAGQQITRADLLADSGRPMQNEAVYSGGGRLLGQIVVSRGARPVPAAVAHVLVADALRAQTSFSNVLGPASLAIGTAFRTPYGERVQVSQFPLAAISALLPAYMARMTDRGGASYILDGNDRVIGTSLRGLSPGALAPDLALRRAIAHHRNGSYTDRGATWNFASGRFVGTDWKLVLATPDAILFAPVSGARQVVPWVLITLLVLSCLIVVALVQRARRDAGRLVIANTELERRNDEVVEANEAKSRFLAGMSHELRTPLNGIIGFTELMYDGRVGPMADQHREFMGDILSSARHLLRLINDVLDLSKVEAGKLEFDSRPVELAALIDETLATLGPLAGEQGVTITTEVDPRLGIVSLDPSRFRQILLNYASNAVTVTEPGGHVTVRAATAADGDLRLEVEDTGPGIAPEDMTKLFTEFAQLRRGRPTATPGTGLGLALTKRLVEAQGGTVWVRSELGRGSVFGATLPCPHLPTSASSDVPDDAPAIAGNQPA